MNTVTVIVPLYYGQKYVRSIIGQVESASRHMAPGDVVELLLVNDAPDAPIEKREYHSELIEIAVLNTDVNRGIHGARVWGASHAKGGYVVFLDQDDVIYEDYIRDQLDKIGEADAIVCRLVNAGRLQYTDSHRFEDVITKDYMLNCWNSIISPGQVLIRKESIPDIWKQNILKNNGADDYFLWLCMLAEGKKIALNQEVLFEHVTTGSNTSDDTNSMMDSECEMIRILLEKHVFTGEDEKCIQKLPDILRRNYVTELEICRDAYSVYGRWFDLALKGDDPVKALRETGIKSVAIYGAGYIGKSISKLMKSTDIRVDCYIDRNARYINLEIPAYTIEDSPQDFGCIIISLFKGSESIRESLKRKFRCPVYTIREILCF